MIVSLIVAMTRDGVIGRGGTLPWRLGSDLARFKRTTMGHHLIMGRKTYESIGRPLPGRTTVVISRREDYRLGGVIVVPSFEAALAVAAADAEPFVVGGGEIYALALPQADRLYVTWVEAEVAGDTRFPSLNWKEWRLVSEERLPIDAKNEYAATYAVYERK